MNRGDFIKKIEGILETIEAIGGEIYEFEIGELATLEEVNELEAKLGQSLPTSLKEVFLNISKSICFNAYMPENIKFPNEYRSIGSIQIEWDMDTMYVENVSEEDWYKEDFEEFNKEVFDLGQIDSFLHIVSVGNGDMLIIPEKTDFLLYWSHEGEGMKYIASNFMEYLTKIVELYGLGLEIWSYEVFLTKDGLDIDSDVAAKFKSYIAYLIEKNKNPFFSDIEDLFFYISFLRNLDQTAITNLSLIEKNNIYEKTLIEIENRPSYNRRVYHQIMATTLRDYSTEWVLKEWNDLDSEINLYDKFYLVTEVFDSEEAFYLISNFLKNHELKDGQINSFLVKMAFEKIKDTSINHLIFNYIEKEDIEPEPSNQIPKSISDLLFEREIDWNTLKRWVYLSSRLRGYIVNSICEHNFSFIETDLFNSKEIIEEVRDVLDFLISKELEVENIEKLKNIRLEYEKIVLN